MPKVQARLFQASELGYYRHGATDAEFGADLDQLLGDMKKWGGALTMEDVRLWEGASDSPILGTYLMDAEKHVPSGDYFLVAWNEVPSHEGEMLAVRKDAPVGGTTITATRLPKNSIPGFPTYYWVLPESEELIHLRVGSGSRGGRKQAEDMIQGFMRSWWPRHVVSTVLNGGIKITGYRANSGASPAKYNPKCRFELTRVPTQLDLIRSKRTSIRKLICKRLVSQSQKAKSGVLKSLLDLIGIKTEPTYSGDLHLKYEVDYSPSEEELEAVFEDFLGDGELDSYENVGVVLKGENKILWLANARVEATFELGLPEERVYSASQISDAIQDRREELLELLESPE